MSQLVIQECKAGNPQVLSDVRRITGENDKYIPTDPKELCNRIFFTCYMGTVNSSNETKQRSADLANQIGSYHLSLTIDEIVKSFSTVFTQVIILNFYKI
jgi:NAD+ synthase (glutamine-hydrolysing)